MDLDLDLFGRVSVEDTGERNAYDYYPTPSWMTLSLLRYHPAIKGATVLEPCSGDDAITRVLRTHGCTVHTNDIDHRHPAETCYDATKAAFWRQAPRVEWIVSNLPFALAFDIMPWCLDHADIGVAMVLRKSWTEPTEDRGPWLNAHPPTRIIGQPRHPFRGSGSDTVACDWHIWERRPDRSLRPFEIDHLAKTRTYHHPANVKD